MKTLIVIFLSLILTDTLHSREYHVSKKGNDTNDGSAAFPLKTISAAAELARAGDTITVHAGIYREWINPAYGGVSDERRILYRAAQMEAVQIKGSEIIREWRHVKGGVWKITLPNSFFGNYNPYKDTLAGDWFDGLGKIHHTGEVFLNNKSLYEVESLEKVFEPAPLQATHDKEGSLYTWYCESDDKTTSLWANFHDSKPNRELVEITVRPACFYPTRTGINFITVRGFQLRQAATQWAPPTAEQIGLIGANWSKGWIIENNVISDSKCSGITLGKDRSTGHNVWSADKTKSGTLHYIEVIFRALKNGWNEDHIGSHIVRNNTIYNCEQTGICGSLGAIFSRITGNHIYNIWSKRQFSGDEIAGIKIHGAIDVLISNNRIHHCKKGIWLDWMAQGTRISDNLLYDNYDQDLFMECNHGPFVADNNILLSRQSILNMSQGGAYTDNLITGKVHVRSEVKRFTPYLFPHSTQVAGINVIESGDDRWYNNIFVGSSSSDQNQKSGTYGLETYKKAELPVWIASNTYYHHATPYEDEINSIQNADFNPGVKLEETDGKVYLLFATALPAQKSVSKTITTQTLGKTKMANAFYENPDGTVLKIESVYFGNARSGKSKESIDLSGESRKIRVW